MITDTALPTSQVSNMIDVRRHFQKLQIFRVDFAPACTINVLPILNWLHTFYWSCFQKSYSLRNTACTSESKRTKDLITSKYA